MNHFDGIADEWIKAWSGKNIASVGQGGSDCILDWELPRERPEEYLDIILIVLDKIRNEENDRLLGLLAAGPLEDLLHENGKQVVDRVEKYARIDPLFRKLLNGVWVTDVEENVKVQLSKYRNERW